MVGKKRKNKKSKDKSGGKPAPVPPRGPYPSLGPRSPTIRSFLKERLGKDISCFPKD